MKQRLQVWSLVSSSLTSLPLLLSLLLSEEQNLNAKKVSTQPVVAPTAAPAPAPATAPPKPIQRTVAPEIKYQYYQSSSSLNLSVLVKNLTSENVSVDFQANHLKILVRVDGFEGTTTVANRSHVVIDSQCFR